VVEFTEKYKKAGKGDFAVEVYFEEGCSVVWP
jgi:hypothetical protein